MTTTRQVTSRRRPTQADVARAAGVSQTTVSYIFNDTPAIRIPEATRHRIQAVIAELGYVPDRAARSLRTGRTHTLACIIPDITNPFYPAVLRGIQDVADGKDYDVLTYNTDGDPEKEARCLRSVQRGGVDGVIAVLFHQTAVQLRELLERGIVVVRLESERKEPDSWPIDNLYVDSVAAARAVVTHLIGCGHRRIGVIGGRKGPRPARVLGYLQALTEHGIEPEDQLMREGDLQEDGARLAMHALLSLAPPPTAVFAVNDLMAISALVAVRDAGLRVPEDIAVAGFDDIPVAQVISPSLTTIAQHPEQLGGRAAEMVFERLRGEAPCHGRSEEMPYELVVRKSA
jgi:LacI family transcriptional regulator